MPYAFCYGTLMTGYRNNVLLAGCMKCGDFLTRPIYRLYDNGSYPCMIRDEKNGNSIKGEIWQINDEVLKRLDQLEGVPWLYQREKVELAEPFVEDVFVYIYQEDVAGMVDCGNSWPRAKAVKV